MDWLSIDDECLNFVYEELMFLKIVFLQFMMNFLRCSNYKKFDNLNPENIQFYICAHYHHILLISENIPNCTS